MPICTLPSLHHLQFYFSHAIMGKASKALKDFLDKIPVEKLEALPVQQQTIFRDQHFRLDMQGVSHLLY